MRWWLAPGLTLVAGTVGTGCPETYGKGGYLDDAMQKDIEEQRQRRLEEEKTLPGKCPDGKPPRDICEGSSPCYRGCP
jgi:hypothetical protein